MVRCVHFFRPRPIFGPEKSAGGSCGSHDTLVLRTKTLLASMAHECTDRTSRRAEIPPPEESTKGGGRRRWPPSPLWSCAKCRLLSGGGISALRLVRSVHSCAMLAKSAFFLKTKVLCPAAASDVFPGQQMDLG